MACLSSGRRQVLAKAGAASSTGNRLAIRKRFNRM
jgi:hypothetical protein